MFRLGWALARYLATSYKIITNIVSYREPSPVKLFLSLQKTGQNRPPKMVGYKGNRSVIRVKLTAYRRRLKSDRLCKLVVFNSYNQPLLWSVMRFWIV